MSAPEQRSQTSRTTKLSFARPPTRKQDPKKFSQKGMPHTKSLYIRFGLVLGRLAILKKEIRPILATFKVGSFMCSWKKKYCSIRTKK